MPKDDFELISELPLRITKFEQYEEKEVKLKQYNTNRIISKPSQASLDKYTVPLGKRIRAKFFENNDCLAYRQYIKKANAITKKKIREVPLKEKYKIKEVCIRNTLFSCYGGKIEDEPVIKTIRDIDDAFFRIINGRKFRQKVPMYKTLQPFYNQYIREKLERAYINDNNFKIELLLRKEHIHHKNAYKKLDEQTKHFYSFVAEDYQKSVDLLAESKKLEILLVDQDNVYKSLANKMFLVRSRIMALNYNYRVHQKYGRFLYYMSPPSWRATHREFASSVEIEQSGFDAKMSHDEDTFEVIYAILKQELIVPVKAVLHFKGPEELMNLYSDIEDQTWYHLNYAVTMTPEVKILRECVSNYRHNLLEENAVVLDSVSDMTSIVKYYEEREEYLRTKFFKMLVGLFHKNVASYDVLNLHVQLEYCYEHVLGKAGRNINFNLSTKTLAKELEIQYLWCIKHIAEIPNYKQLFKDYARDEKLKMKRAEKASLELKSFEILKKKIYKSYEPRPDVKTLQEIRIKYKEIGKQRLLKYKSK